MIAADTTLVEGMRDFPRMEYPGYIATIPFVIYTISDGSSRFLEDGTGIRGFPRMGWGFEVSRGWDIPGISLEFNDFPVADYL
jgi:hypothetical protein